MQDTDKAPAEPVEPVKMTQTGIVFNHPVGFVVGTMLTIAIDQQGKCFINMPPEPMMALHLLNQLTGFVIPHVMKVIEGARQKSALVVAPAGSLPPWNGPAGRG